MTFSLSSLVLVAALAVPTLASSSYTLQPLNYSPMLRNFTPSNSVSMEYGGARKSYVDVLLNTTSPAIMLEKLSAVSSVDCDDFSVSIAFNSSSAFAAASSAWQSPCRNTGLLFITNHLGDCDIELERGFFLADSIISDNKTMTIVATTSKQEIGQTATEIEINFKGLPQTTPTDLASSTKRGIDASPSLTFGNSLTLPPTVLFAKEPLTLTAHESTISASATLSGTIRYSISEFSLKQFTLDFNTSLSADLDLDMVLTGAYKATPKYTTPSLEYDVLNIPGILTLGPELAFDMGVHVDVGIALAAQAKVGTSINNGSVHIDVLNKNRTTTSGWMPEFTQSVNISEKANAIIDPYVDLKVGIACEILAGAFDLSVAVEAQPRFKNEFALVAEQHEDSKPWTNSTTGGGSGAGSDACSNGVDVFSDFKLALIATVTQFWKGTIYELDIPVADKCYDFY